MRNTQTSTSEASSKKEKKDKGNKFIRTYLVAGGCRRLHRTRKKYGRIGYSRTRISGTNASPKTDGTYKLTSATNLWRNVTFHVYCKAEFVTLVSLRVPSGTCWITCLQYFVLIGESGDEFARFSNWPTYWCPTALLLCCTVHTAGKEIDFVQARKKEEKGNLSLLSLSLLHPTPIWEEKKKVKHTQEKRPFFFSPCTYTRRTVQEDGGRDAIKKKKEREGKENVSTVELG